MRIRFQDSSVYLSIYLSIQQDLSVFLSIYLSIYVQQDLSARISSVTACYYRLPTRTTRAGQILADHHFQALRPDVPLLGHLAQCMSIQDIWSDVSLFGTTDPMLSSVFIISIFIIQARRNPGMLESRIPAIDAIFADNFDHICRQIMYICRQIMFI